MVQTNENPEKELLEKLHSLQIQSVLIEGGQRTLQRFIDLNLWDEARILVGNKYFGKGLKAPVLEKTPTHIECAAEDKIVFIKNQPPLTPPKEGDFHPSGGVRGDYTLQV
jgi:diaminohydroxyphosphoribosylaminopyrimidine deaminase/5-amino-6-(5-phosphoribosylamino)uracil reductase